MSCVQKISTERIKSIEIITWPGPHEGSVLEKWKTDLLAMQMSESGVITTAESDCDFVMIAHTQLSVLSATEALPGSTTSTLRTW